MNDGTVSAGPLRGERTAAHPAPNRNASWSLYLGLLGVGLGFMLMFTVLTPAGVITGVRGLREIAAEPGQRGRGRAWTGIGLSILAPPLWVGLFVGLLAFGVI